MTEISPSELRTKYEGRARIDPHIHLEGPLKGAPEVIDYLDRYGVDVGFLIASPLKEGKGSMKEDMPSLQKKYLGGLGNTVFGHFVSDSIMRPLVKGMTVEKPDNNRVIAASKEHPDRLMPWIFANPGLEIKKTLDEISAFANRKDISIAGLKLHFWVYPADIVDPSVMQIADIAAEKNLPILIDVGVNRGNMKSFQEFAKMHPTVPIIAAHLGSNLQEVIDAASRNENVFLDMSGYPVTGDNLRKISKKLAPDKVISIGVDGIARFGQAVNGAANKIIWGSDSPGGLGGSITSQLKALHDARLTPSQEDLILTGNITSIIPQVSKLLKARS